MTKRKRKWLPIYAQCACGEYRSFCLTTTDSGEVKCSKCAFSADGRRGLCRCCWKENVPVEEHHVAGWRCSDFTIDVCLTCHKTLSIILQPFMELQGRHGCGASAELFFLIIGVAALIYTIWHRGDVDLQPFLKINREFRSSLKVRP